jgi:NADH-quinone oxidoreductase subunit J
VSESGPLIAFALLGMVAIIASLGVVLAPNVVQAAVSLVGALLAVAGLYVVLLADFLALVQVLIYGGAVTILLLFALMLHRVGRDPTLDNRQKPLAALAALVSGGFLLLAAILTPWPVAAFPPEQVSLPLLGTVLFGTWALPFEVVSLVLLVALIGAVVIARAGGPS